MVYSEKNKHMKNQIKSDIRVVHTAKLYLHVAVHCKFFINYCFQRHPFQW